MIKEYASICCWEENETVFEIIRNEFTIAEELQLERTVDEKHNLLKKMYYPHNVRITDPRVQSKSKITIFVLELNNPKVEIISRREHKKKPMYADLIKFKEYIRGVGTNIESKRMVVCHMPDWLNEANHFFEVFGLTKYINKNKYYRIDELSGIIFTDDKGGWKNLMIQKINETPHYKYARGDKHEYIKYVNEIDKSRSFEKVDKMVKTVPESISSLPPIILCRDIDGTTLKVWDGLHRASFLSAAGHLYVKGYEKPEEQCRNCNNAKKVYVHDHDADFQMTIDELNNNNIRYVISRGFKNLPQSPDTDIDLICHPDDYQKLDSIVLKRLALKHSKKLVIDGTECKYIQYKTTKAPRRDIANTYFHVDVYDHCYTWYIKKVLMSFGFLDELFSKRIKRDFYYIPCAEHEIFLLLMRMVLECKTVKRKHKERVSELLPSANRENIIEMFNEIKDDEIRNYFTNRVFQENLLS